MRIEFTGYAEDSIVHGDVSLDVDRLSDFLSGEGDFTVEGVTLQALDDGRLVTLASTEMSRDELYAVVASGPRGHSGRRLNTRLHPIRAALGPYIVFGYLHAPPTADPVSAALRKPIIPLTSASIEYSLGGEKAEDIQDALLLNREKIDWLQHATDADVRLANAFELHAKHDPRA